MTLKMTVLSGVAALCAAGPGAAADSRWALSVDEESYDGRQLLSQAALDSIPDEYATKEVTPVLSFFCADDAVAMRIDWRRFISSFSTEAGFSIDGGDATWLKLGVDSSNKVTLADAPATSSLIESIGDGSVLRVEIAPYSEPSVFVSFELETLPTKLAELRETC